MPLLRLMPSGRTREAAAGRPLRDALAAVDLEFPCGGRGRCGGCRVRVLEGDLPETPADALLPEELRARGWRLACQALVAGDLALESRGGDPLALSDDGACGGAAGEEGLGIAVDLGTTTVVSQLVDLRDGRVLATSAGLNAQARWGADVVSRLSHAMSPGGAGALREAVSGQLGAMLARLLEDAPGALRRILVVGNPAMQHLLLGADVRGLSAAPFVPAVCGPVERAGRDFGWDAGDVPVLFPQSLGGHVGSDTLAAILATGIWRREGPAACVDLGTNGGIALGGRGRILVASAAAGPAFEGAGISSGMRASRGAVDRVWRRGAGLEASVIGGGEPEGICGSGLVDAVACALDLGLVAPSGHLPGGRLSVRPPLSLTQRDVRELQLAKAAVAAGIRLLLGRLGRAQGDLEALYLAGAFGNSVSAESAGRIGLFRVATERVHPVGNAALRGARMALAEGGMAALAEAASRAEHVPLAGEPRFEEAFLEEIGYPEGGGCP